MPFVWWITATLGPSPHFLIWLRLFQPPPYCSLSVLRTGLLSLENYTWWDPTMAPGVHSFLRILSSKGIYACGVRPKGRRKAWTLIEQLCRTLGHMFPCLILSTILFYHLFILNFFFFPWYNADKLSLGFFLYFSSWTIRFIWERWGVSHHPGHPHPPSEKWWLWQLVPCRSVSWC